MTRSPSDFDRVVMPLGSGIIGNGSAGDGDGDGDRDGDGSLVVLELVDSIWPMALEVETEVETTGVVAVDEVEGFEVAESAEDFLELPVLLLEVLAF